MVKLLGPPSIEGVGTFPSRGYELLSLLSFADGSGINRHALATVMWPERVSASALGNLRFTIHAINTWSAVNGVPVIAVTRGRVFKAPGLMTDLDVMLATPMPKTLQQLTSYANSFAGELLDTYETPSAEFEDWLRRRRLELQHKFVETVLAAASALHGPEVDDALQVAELRSPFDERLLIARVKSLVGGGRRSMAAKAYRTFRERHVAELGADLTMDARQSIALWLPETLTVQASVEHASVKADSANGVVDAGRPTVLMLPPISDAPHTAQAHYLSRALVSEVTVQLGRMRTFAMFAPHTARRSDAGDPIAAARAVGASYLVSTHLMGGRSKLGFSLVHTASQEILIADYVPVRPGSGEENERLATAVAAAISQHIASVETRRFRRTGEASAYVHYLLGQERLRYDLKSIRKARSHFQRAATLSPRFAPAHAMIARSLTYEWLVLGRQEPDLLHEAYRLASFASDLDPLLPLGSWEKGHALLYMQRLDESLEHLDRAIEFAPHVADTIADRADVLVHLGDGKGAKATIGRAMELNPLPPDDYHWVLGSSEFLLGDYQATLRSFHRMADTLPVARLMAACYAMLGDMEMARANRERWLEQYPDFKVEDWARLIPMRDKTVAERVIVAMRTAGFS